jgi:hypothetical protein
VEAAGVEVDRSGSPIAGRALLEDSLARLAAAGDDVGAAEVHVNGLAELLNVSERGGWGIRGAARGGGALGAWLYRCNMTAESLELNASER